MAELVADHVRRQIVRGELVEGDALPSEAELMQRFGVSRPTLREAYRVLGERAESPAIHHCRTYARENGGRVGAG